MLHPSNYLQTDYTQSPFYVTNIVTSCWLAYITELGSLNNPPPTQNNRVPMLSMKYHYMIFKLVCGALLVQLGLSCLIISEMINFIPIQYTSVSQTFLLVDPFWL